jgi:uncharacterized protein YfbU (UPF0304 family)
MMEMDYWERAKLANQCRILEHLEDDASEGWRKARIIFERGYTRDYSWAMNWVREQETNQQVCDEVVDILEMFSRLEHSYKKLGGVSGVDQDDVRFQGFSGNDEGQHLDYATFLVEEAGKFSRLKNDVKDSHFPTLHRYRPMLQEYQDQNTSSPALGANAIQEIVQAGESDS